MTQRLGIENVAFVIIIVFTYFFTMGILWNIKDNTEVVDECFVYRVQGESRENS